MNLKTKEYQTHYQFLIKNIKSPKMIISKKNMGSMTYIKNEKNRNNFQNILNLSKNSIIGLKQTHSKSIIDLPLTNIETQGDGLYSCNESDILSITVADCLPIYIFTPTGFFSILHSGWKGTGILKNGIKKVLKESKVNNDDLYLVFGPSIRSCCYKVDDQRALKFKQEFGDNSIKISNDQYYISLISANKNIANALGIKNIYISNMCTHCNSSLGSFRRQGPQDFTPMMAIMGYF